jgi:hypothetical protein
LCSLHPAIFLNGSHPRPSTHLSDSMDDNVGSGGHCCALFKDGSGPHDVVQTQRRRLSGCALSRLNQGLRMSCRHKEAGRLGSAACILQTSPVDIIPRPNILLSDSFDEDVDSGGHCCALSKDGSGLQDVVQTQRRWVGWLCDLHPANPPSRLSFSPCAGSLS